MQSHFGAIGFGFQTEDEFAALAEQIAEEAQAIDTKAGNYLRWHGANGEELWLQINRAGELVGMNPHFAGSSSLRVGVLDRIRRPNDTPLDGGFRGWADPGGAGIEAGAYPFVFSTPDFETYADFRPPGVVEVQIAAFAHNVTLHESPEAFSEAQAQQDVKMASKSFIPTGLFGLDRASDESPEAMALFTGHVIEAAAKENAMTGAPFYWALVDTLGGRYDVVVDHTLLPQVPSAGEVLSGEYWLSGRLVSFPKQKRTWFGKLFGRAGQPAAAADRTSPGR